MSGLHASTGGQDPRGGPTVTLIHGAGGNRTQWAIQARHLAARGFDVLAFDLPGHGNSPGPACDTVEDYTTAVLDELANRSVDTFAVAGHSMGGMIAIAIAADAPQRCTHLALVASGLSLSMNPALLEGARDTPEVAAEAMIDWGHSAASHLGGGETPGLWMDGTDLAVLRREVVAHPGSLHADLAASEAFDGTTLATSITCPTLVISGECDLMTPPALGRAAAAAISDSHYVELEGAGHMLMTERPLEVAKALHSFFSTPGG